MPLREPDAMKIDTYHHRPHCLWGVFASAIPYCATSLYLESSIKTSPPNQNIISTPYIYPYIYIYIPLTIFKTSSLLSRLSRLPQKGFHHYNTSPGIAEIQWLACPEDCFNLAFYTTPVSPERRIANMFSRAKDGLGKLNRRS